MTVSGLDRLNDGQRDCLRLVLAHLNSKEIARELGVSPHTVDQRLRIAMRILGAQSRFEAARIFARLDQENSYQPLIYQSQPLASDPEPASSSAQPDRPDEPREHRSLLHRILAFGPPLGGSTNELSIDGRILAMIRAAVLTGVGVVTLLLLLAGAFRVLA